MPISPQCEAGCLSFEGGEVKHHRDCVHYPESLTKLWHDTEAEYQAEIERLRAAARELISADIDSAGGSPEAWAARMEAWHNLRRVVGYRLPADSESKEAD